MTFVRLNPYLNFDGNTKEAMEFYHHVLGGELTLTTFKEGGMDVPGYEDKIMHAQLECGDIIIMASEGEPGKKVNFGDSVTLSLSGTDTGRLTSLYEGLSVGGEILMPLEKQVWGDTFGHFKDKFGILWMVNIIEEQTQQA